jgi:2-desacetyl-2-hydroxyethyl bacteriochlorophyllide A dehydrogenase
MDGTMKAVIYQGIGSVSIEERPIPQIGDYDILVKNLRAGICGSDIGAYKHGGDSYAIFSGSEFGHEMVSIVVEKGKKVADDIQIGQHVFVNPMNCKKEGALRTATSGAFSEYVNVENAKAGHNIYVLSKELDLDTAAIIEPLSVGTEGAVKFGTSSTDKIVVLGTGAIGMSAAAGLIARGLKDVCVVARRDWKADKARELGALVVNNATQPLMDTLIEYFGASYNTMGTCVPNVDLYVDCVGDPALFQECFANGRRGTKYSIVAVHTKPVTLDFSPFLMNEAMVCGSLCYTDKTICEVIEHITEGKSKIANMITAKFQQDDFVEAIEVAAKAEKDIKVLIDYEL